MYYLWYAMNKRKINDDDNKNNHFILVNIKT